MTAKEKLTAGALLAAVAPKDPAAEARVLDYFARHVPDAMKVAPPPPKRTVAPTPAPGDRDPAHWRVDPATITDEEVAKRLLVCTDCRAVIEGGYYMRAPVLGRERASCLVCLPCWERHADPTVCVVCRQAPPTQHGTVDDLPLRHCDACYTALARSRDDLHCAVCGTLELLPRAKIFVPITGKVYCGAEHALQRPPTVVHVNQGEDAYDLYIGRAYHQRGYHLDQSEWANPHALRADARADERQRVIAQYEAWLLKQPALLARLSELTGLRLACWCTPKRCHGEVLVRQWRDAVEGR